MTKIINILAYAGFINLLLCLLYPYFLLAYFNANNVDSVVSLWMCMIGVMFILFAVVDIVIATALFRRME